MSEMNKHEYLEKFVFKDLTNLNDGFDAEGIKYFSEEDFKIILSRIEKLKIGVVGIEPWLDGNFYDVKCFEDYGAGFAPDSPEWFWHAFEGFKKENRNLMYAATYYIPEAKLIEP